MFAGPGEKVVLESGRGTMKEKYAGTTQNTVLAQDSKYFSIAVDQSIRCPSFTSHLLVPQGFQALFWVPWRYSGCRVYTNKAVGTPREHLCAQGKA